MYVDLIAFVVLLMDVPHVLVKSTTLVLHQTAVPNVLSALSVVSIWLVLIRNVWILVPIPVALMLNVKLSITIPSVLAQLI